MSPEEILAQYQRYGIEEVETPKEVADSGDAGTSASARAQNLPRAPKAKTAVVWKLHADNTIEPVRVSLGITDHAYTEVTRVLKGQLKEGSDVVIRSVTPKTQALGGIRR
jgi:hypothetical protein